jgi:hypothetical protein
MSSDTVTEMMGFSALTNDEIAALVKMIIGANRAVAAEYGNDSAMNAEIVSVFDAIEPVADARGLVFS